MRRPPRFIRTRARSVAALLVVAAAVGVPVFAAPGAPEFRVKHWTTADGLPQGTINDIALLENGEMWLATFGGLVRFDGHTFTVLDIAADEAVPANRIVALAPAGADSLLFLTQQGHLGRVERGRPRLLVSPPLPSVDVIDLFVGAGGSVFCRSTRGLVWRTDGQAAWQRVAAAPVGDGSVSTVEVDADGQLWAIAEDRLLRWHGEEWVVIATLPGHAQELAPARESTTWLGVGTALGRYRAGTLEFLDVRPAFGAPVSVIAPAGDDAAWVATAFEVSRVERESDGRWRRRALPMDFRPPFNVLTLSGYRDDALWVGTAGDGLYRAIRTSVRRFGAESGFGAVQGLADGKDGVFVSSGCGELFRLDAAGTTHQIPLSGLLAGQAIGGCQIALARRGDGTVLARVGPALISLGPGAATRVIATGLPAEEGPLVVGPDGAAWVVSRSGRVQRIEPDGRHSWESTLPAPLVSALAAPDGSVWIGGDNIVYRMKGSEIDRFGASEFVPRGEVRDILVDRDDTVWIATYGGGIGRLHEGRVARLTVRDGLPDNAVSRLLLDRRGRMWISTNRGVAVVDRDQLMAVAEGRAPRLVPVILGEDRGVPEANFGAPAGFIGGDGRIWLGTIAGVVVLDGEAFPSNTRPPRVLIETVRADDRPLAPGPVVDVPPLTSRVRIAFTAFELLHSDHIRFRFRFEGTDPDWVDAGTNRFIDWSPPGPGRHRVFVEARNEDGIWSATPAELILQVQPAWWQTTAFTVAAVVCAVLLAAVGIRARVRVIERRHATRLRVLEEQRRAEDRMASVRAQLELVSRAALAGELTASIAHEVRQPLGAIVNNAEAGRRHLEQYLRNPEELKHLLDDIVQDGLRASEVVQGLRGFLQPGGPEATRIDLSALVRDVLPLIRRELDDNHVRLELSLADGLPPVDGLRVQLSQVVLNFVINAVEAVARQEGPRRVVVSTAAHDGRVELAVEDNGPGLSPAVAGHLFEPFVTTKPGGLGVGLAICRSIAERHGGRIMVASPPGAGFRITLALPTAPPADGTR